MELCRDCLIGLSMQNKPKAVQQIRALSPGTKKQVCAARNTPSEHRKAGERYGASVAWPINGSCFVIGSPDPSIKSQEFQFEAWRASISWLRHQRALDIPSSIHTKYMGTRSPAEETKSRVHIPEGHCLLEVSVASHEIMSFSDHPRYQE